MARGKKIESTEWVFKDGCRLPKRLAAPAIKECREIFPEFGKTGDPKYIDIKILLKEAERRGPESHIYQLFEWDNQTAAHKYRLDQGRYFVRHLEVIITYVGGETVQVPAFVREFDTEPEMGKYTATLSALGQPDHADFILDRARREAEAWLYRYQHLSELAPLADQIRRAIAALRRRENDAA